MTTVIQGTSIVKWKNRVNPEKMVGTPKKHLKDSNTKSHPCYKREMKPTSYSRETAWILLNEYTQSASLLKHALAVETCTRAYGETEAAARGLTADDAGRFAEVYAVTGLLHDFDYERFPTPQEHPLAGNRILIEQGWPEEIREAILGHAQYSGVPRQSHLAKVLFACDELAGFLTAVSLVKPTRSILDVEVAAVRKKMKDKAFARSVSREDIVDGARELGVDLDQHIEFCVAAMRKNAKVLGLERAVVEEAQS
jgi:predicted hydrolase (HD superfamily)